ncbi:hypothetical protein Tco_0227689 [Tanacetum coccineum]
MANRPQCVADALAKYEKNQNSDPGNANGDGSHHSAIGSGRPVRTARECTCKELLNCQPLNFKGTEGVVGLTQWFENMEFVFHISDCTTVGHDVAYGMPWRTLMKMMTDKYCPRSEIKKLDIELWNLKVEKYVGRLPENIQGNVMSARPKMMQEAIELANDLMHQKVHTYVERQADNKRILYNNPRDNHDQQPPFKRQNMDRAYTGGPGEKKVYAGTLPLCNNPAAANNQRTLTCFKCGNQGNYRSDCPELKNRNRRNQARSSKARGRMYPLGGGESDQDPNNIEDEIEA